MENNYTIFYKQKSKSAIYAFLVTMILVSVVFPHNIQPLHLWVFNLISVVGFFYGSWHYTRYWAIYPNKHFEKKLFKTSFLIRIFSVITMYVFYMLKFENFFGPAIISTDASWYVDEAYDSANRLANGTNIISRLMNEFGIQIDDTGYISYLAVVYLLTGKISKIVLPLILKALWGALTCISVYRIAQRHFSRDAARMAAVFCMLCPNMIWWCGCMMKETEMVFLSTLFIEQADSIIIERQKWGKKIITLVLSGLFLFLFRNALGAVCIIALLFAIVFSSTRIVSWSKRIVIAILTFSLLAISLNNAIREQFDEMIKSDIRAEQKMNMEWRVDRDGGNQFAKYASAAVFAPLIFTIPFPTLSYTYLGQELLMENGGGNFVKNVTSFFVIFCVLLMLFTGGWKSHVLPLSFVCGYLVVLIFSSYAQSGRFHMPIVPFEMMFAAVGYTMMERGVAIYKNIGGRNFYNRCFSFFLFIEVIVCVGWQYFKLKGQGLI